MKEILEAIVRWFGFLWDDGRYRIVDSIVSKSFGGDAYLVVSSDALRIRFVRDRGQVFVDFQEPWASDKAEWYSIDLVRRLITGEKSRSAELDEGFAAFMRESLADVEARFSNESAFRATRSELGKLERIRSKEMFG